jgi:hypothetical protein
MIKKLIIILLPILINAKSDICQTQWIQDNGTRYQPPESVKVLTLTFMNDLDSVQIDSKNYGTTYYYESFLNIKGKLGISYKASNGDIVDMFQNGNLIVWRKNTPLLKAYCPTLKLDISKIN